MWDMEKTEILSGFFASFLTRKCSLAMLRKLLNAKAGYKRMKSYPL